MALEPTTLRTDQSRVYYNTTAYWTAHDTLIPKKGAIIVYTDAFSTVVDGQQKDMPAIKIGDGRSYIADIEFLGQYESQIMLDHINDNVRHITQQEREHWNNKLNFAAEPVVNETLIFTRN